MYLSERSLSFVGGGGDMVASPFLAKFAALIAHCRFMVSIVPTGGHKGVTHPRQKFCRQIIKIFISASTFSNFLLLVGYIYSCSRLL